MIQLPGTAETITSPRIFCIGRNYAKHAKEMNSAVPSKPMVFLKPSTALIRNGDAIQYPPQSSEMHHEGELVVVIGKQVKNVREEEAMECVAGYAAGLDMTARDIQAQAKQKGHPWSVAKGFDTFAPLGEIVPASAVADPQNLSISLQVNCETRQDGHTRDMIFPVATLIAYCSSIFTLLPGDLIYTGTPEGVGPVQKGDQLEVSITGIPSLQVSVQ